MIELIQKVTRETLDAITTIANTAEQKIWRPKGGGTGALANPKAPKKAIQRIEKMNKTEMNNLLRLGKEPAMARVVATSTETSKRKTYYICRNTTLQVEGITLAGYRAQIAKIVEYKVGEKVTVPLPKGNVTFHIDESAIFTPKRRDGEWDAIGEQLEGIKYKWHQIGSFRAWLTKYEDVSESDAQLQEQQYEQTKLRRNLISKMELRDQPILDRFQGEIFRLPLSSKLFIAGAPGTGKTTTLIRRLGQKLDTYSDSLTEEEKITVERSGSGEHPQSWLMFTPTELLKLYIKEAFNREGIAAPDSNIKTWDEYRRNLARATFGILRTPTKGGGFVMKDEANTLLPETQTHSGEWFVDFNKWQTKLFWENTRKAATDLLKNAPQSPIARKRVTQVAEQINSTLRKNSDSLKMRDLARLLPLSDDISDIQRHLRQDSSEKIKRTLNLLVNRDKEFLQSLGEYSDSIAESELEPDDEEFSEADEENPSSQYERTKKAELSYRRAIRAYTRAKVQNRTLNASSRNGKIIKWLDKRVPDTERVNYIGRSLVIQSFLRRFANPLRQFIYQIPRRYRAYRREFAKQGKWYRANNFLPSDIHPLEVDIILLTMLSSTNEIFRVTSRAHRKHEVFEGLNYLYRNQIVVDEATDFSPVQLKCMHELCNRNTQSFFACGDLNQRLTNVGIRSNAQMEWAIPNIELKPVSVVYRQSEQLFRFSNALIRKSAIRVNSQLPPDVDSHGVAPVIKESIPKNTDIARWLAERIAEVQQATEAEHQSLPSIAILVNDEETVTTLEELLKPALQNQNLEVIGCLKGQVRGNDDAVKIFNVQHIKGLEFEAVFFVGIDQIEKDLYEKYLYVGATRAATYLGMTCQNKLPKQLEHLREMFRERFIS